MTDEVFPEHASIEAFAEFLVDEERETFTFTEAETVAKAIEEHVSVVIRELRTYGLAMVPREPERRVRGFQTSSHDRWYGPGSSRTHGGSGHEQISGFGGQEG